MGVHADDDVGIGLAKDQVPNRGAAEPSEWDVAELGHRVAEVLEVVGYPALRVVVDDDERRLVQNLRLEHPDGLDREVHAIEIVVRGHPDTQSAMLFGRAWLRDRVLCLFPSVQLADQTLENAPRVRGHRPSVSTWHRGHGSYNARPMPDVSEARPSKAPNLEISEVEDGVVVYQDEPERVHHLNRSAALIFELSTGDRTVGDIAEELRAVFAMSEAPHDLVADCVRQLYELSLIY
jgi:hypothetical protein